MNRNNGTGLKDRAVASIGREHDCWSAEFDLARFMLDDSIYHGTRIEVVGLSGCGEMTASTVAELEEYTKRCNGDASFYHITPNGRIRSPIRLNEQGQMMSPAEIAAEVCEADRRAGATVEAKQTTGKGASDNSLSWRRLSTIDAQDVDWLWPNRVANGKCNLFYGDGGVGKSFALVDMMARITTGTPWPDCRDAPNVPGHVLLLNAEDDPNDTIRVRFDAQRGDASRVAFIDGVKRGKDANESCLSLVLDLDLIEQLATETRAKLLIIDPVTVYTGGVDIYKDDAVRSITTPLKAVAQRLGMAVVLVMHTNKTATTNAKHKAANSAAWINACRMAWLFAEDPNDPHRRTMTNAKNNLVYNCNGLSFGFDEATGSLKWNAEPVNMTASQVLAEAADHGKATLGREAEGFLRDTLSDGSIDSKDLLALAKEDGISEKTLRRAKKKLGILSPKDGFGGGHRWELPTGEMA